MYEFRIPPVDAQREVTASADAAALQPIATPITASAPADAAIDAAETPRKTARRPGTRRAKKPSVSRDSNATAAPHHTDTTERGSAAPRKYDPNLPLGED